MIKVRCKDCKENYGLESYYIDSEGIIWFMNRQDELNEINLIKKVLLEKDHYFSNKYELVRIKVHRQ